MKLHKYIPPMWDKPLRGSYTACDGKYRIDRIRKAWDVFEATSGGGFNQLTTLDTLAEVREYLDARENKGMKK